MTRKDMLAALAQAEVGVEAARPNAAEEPWYAVTLGSEVTGGAPQSS